MFLQKNQLQYSFKVYLCYPRIFKHPLSLSIILARSARRSSSRGSQLMRMLPRKEMPGIAWAFTWRSDVPACWFEHVNYNNDWILGISVDASWILTWFVQIRAHASCVFMSYKEQEFTSTEEIKSKWFVCFPWGFVFYSSWLEILFVTVICIDYTPIGSSM